MVTAAVDEALVERKNALVEAFHARIDGDYLVGGGGWGREGWVDDIPHDQARISDIVRWAVNAMLAADAEAPAEHAADVRREVVEEIAATFEARCKCYALTHPNHAHDCAIRADHAATLVRTFAAPPRSP